METAKKSTFLLGALLVGFLLFAASPAEAGRNKSNRKANKNRQQNERNRRSEKDQNEWGFSINLGDHGSDFSFNFGNRNGNWAPYSDIRTSRPPARRLKNTRTNRRKHGRRSQGQWGKYWVPGRLVKVYNHNGYPRYIRKGGYWDWKFVPSRHRR